MLGTPRAPRLGQCACRHLQITALEFSAPELVQAVSEKRRLRHEAHDAELLQCVMEGLNYTSGPTAAVRETLSREKRTRADKRAKLHAAWTAGVFDKIQGRVQAAVNALSTDDIEARLRRNMDVRSALLRFARSAPDACQAVQAPRPGTSGRADP